ncbi:serine/threonine protein kinase [Candidatus Uabimicrobium amorphum]|uniref:non-specific serine/threonine protein kinase n=1 Tax=Uabimicrobium amorphum TaxID=2596890 RepID=A0A5S9IRU6_UABAM|nr:serine/threonine-protein kinase [Candidatus Uabimicrobium amorphum]BBM86446.1 protein kinase [Candidatus Uabimicrobium amorphum]
MDAKDALFAHAAVSFGYISEEQLGRYAQELAVRRKKNKAISLENLLVEQKIFTSQKVAEIYAKVSQNLQVDGGERHSKTLTMCDDQPQVSFTIAPGSMSKSKESGQGLAIQSQEQESIFLGNAIGQKLGRYVITGRLGRGGMGIVYKAKDETLKRAVAIKVLINSQIDSVHSERFVREAQTVASLNHPNIMQIHDISKLGNNYYLVVEFIDGEPLSAIIKRQAPLDIVRTLTLIKKVAEGLDAAHKLKIIHRDIKPANIMISSNDEPKVTDFGLAKMPSAASLSHTGQVVGTPSYMAPEQVEGKPVDNRSDLYSLGITFYEMLCGNLPLKGDNLYNIMMSHVHKEPTPIQKYNQKIDDALASIVAKMMAKKPEDRFQNGKQIVEAINEYMQHGKKRVHKVAAPPKKKRSWFSVLVMLILLAGAGLFAMERFYPQHKFSQKIRSGVVIAKKKIMDTLQSFKDKKPREKYPVKFTVEDPFYASHEFLISIMRETKDDFVRIKRHTPKLPAGKYVYKIEKQGYKPLSKSFEVRAGKELHIHEKMEVLPRKIDFSIIDIKTEKEISPEKIVVNGQILEGNVILPGKVVIHVEFEHYESIALEKMILPSDKTYTVKVKLALVVKKPIIEDITYELTCIKREEDRFKFFVDEKPLQLDHISETQQLTVFSAKLPRSARKLRVEHAYYFTEITLEPNKKQINVVFQNTTDDRILNYLKQLDSGKTLETISHLIYREDFQFSRQLVKNLMDLMKNLRFKEQYQYRYRSSLINELRLKKIEDNNGK